MVRSNRGWMCAPRCRWCSISTSASAATPAASPARISGPIGPAPSTCGGTTSRRSRAPAIRRCGKTRRTRTAAGKWAPTASCVCITGKRERSVQALLQPEPAGARRLLRPWTYRYNDLFEAPEGDDQPTALPISQITGEPMDIEAGPNWDDDLSGSPVYAENDPNLDALDEDERQALFDVERLTMMYLPRICNHCANPSCVAACPSGALYKRGEDGIVLVNQESCRGWRACVAACPYKKVYYNWKTGKVGEMHSLLSASRNGAAARLFPFLRRAHPLYGGAALRREPDREAAKAPDEALVEAQRALILDPFDPEVIERRGERRHRDDRSRAALAGLEVREGVGAGAPAPPRVPHDADALLCAAAAAGDGKHGRRGLRSCRTSEIFGAIDDPVFR